MKRKLIVISADAMVDEDLKLLKELPNYRSIAHKVSMVEHVRTIYPTVTYPAHTSMRTGWITAGAPAGVGRIRHPGINGAHVLHH